MRFVLEIAYKGAKYNGWQKQPNAPSVQNTIEEKITTMLGEQLVIFSASRTDRGVHAEMQYAHFDYQKEINKYKFLCSINNMLKHDDIVIKNIYQVANDFHARYSAIFKTYTYNFCFAKHQDPFIKDKCWIIFNYTKDFCIDEAVNKIREASKYLIGEHDFSSFRHAQCQAKSRITTINSIDLARKDAYIETTINGKSFMQHQIRIIMGTLVGMVLRNDPTEKIRTILEEKKREAAYATAPPYGLTLRQVHYREDFANFEEVVKNINQPKKT